LGTSGSGIMTSHLKLGCGFKYLNFGRGIKGRKGLRRYELYSMRRGNDRVVGRDRAGGPLAVLDREKNVGGRTARRSSPDRGQKGGVRERVVKKPRVKVKRQTESKRVEVGEKGGAK